MVRLPSRDIIADSIEAVCTLSVLNHTLAHPLDTGHNGTTIRTVTVNSTLSFRRALTLFWPGFQAQYYDGNISLPGCDKNMPGCAMAAVRHNRPTIIVYGGTIQAGQRHVDCPAMGYKKGDPVNISDAFESYGESLR